MALKNGPKRRRLMDVLWPLKILRIIHLIVHAGISENEHF